MRSRSPSRVSSGTVPVQWAQFEASMRARGFRTIEAMAREVGSSKANLHRVKAGEITPSLPLILAMADAAELDLYAFLGRKAPRQREAA